MRHAAQISVLLRPVPLGLVALLVLPAGVAMAQPLEGTGANPLVRAVALADEGDRLFKAHAYREAAALYRQATVLDPTRWPYAWNLARSLEEAEDCGAAPAALQAVLALPDLPAAQHTAGRQRLAALQVRCAPPVQPEAPAAPTPAVTAAATPAAPLTMPPAAPARESPVAPPPLPRVAAATGPPLAAPGPTVGLERESGGVGGWTVAAATAAGLGLIAGGVGVLLAQSNEEGMASAADPSAMQDSYDRLQIGNGLQLGGFALAGVGALAAGILLLVDGDDSPATAETSAGASARLTRSATRLKLLAGPDGLGLSGVF